MYALASGCRRKMALVKFLQKNVKGVHCNQFKFNQKMDRDLHISLLFPFGTVNIRFREG